MNAIWTTFNEYLGKRFRATNWIGGDWNFSRPSKMEANASKQKKEYIIQRTINADENMLLRVIVLPGNPDTTTGIKATRYSPSFSAINVSDWGSVDISTSRRRHAWTLSVGLRLLRNITPPRFTAFRSYALTTPHPKRQAAVVWNFVTNCLLGYHAN